MGHHHTRLRTIRCKSEAVDDVVQTRLKHLQKIQTCQAAALTGSFIVAAELAFQHAIDTAGALFGAQLAQIIGLAPRAAATAMAARAAMLTRGKTAPVNGAFRSEAAFALQVELF